MEVRVRRFSSQPYVIATLWALALVLSSWVFQNMRIGDWVNAALYLGAGVWLTSAMRRPRTW